MLCLREQRIWTFRDQQAGPPLQRAQLQLHQSWLNTACVSGAVSRFEGEGRRMVKTSWESQVWSQIMEDLEEWTLFHRQLGATDGFGSRAQNGVWHVLEVPKKKNVEKS